MSRIDQKQQEEQIISIYLTPLAFAFLGQCNGGVMSNHSFIGRICATPYKMEDATIEYAGIYGNGAKVDITLSKRVMLLWKKARQSPENLAKLLEHYALSTFFTYIWAQTQLGLSIDNAMSNFFKQYNVPLADINVDTLKRAYSRFKQKQKKAAENTA